MLLNPDRYWWLMPSSMILAFFWQFWPMGQTIRQFGPDAIVMVTLYWALRKPQHISSGWALLIGLLIDSAEGCPLGVHALAMVVIVYIIQLMNERIRMFAIWQQSMVVGALYLIYLFICNTALLLDTHNNRKSIMMLTAISTGIGWPACYLFLQWLEQGTRRGPIRS